MEAAIGAGLEIVAAVVVEGSDPGLADRIAAACARSGAAFQRVSRSEISNLVGYAFHRGVVACFSKPAVLRFTGTWLPKRPAAHSPVVFAPGIADASNLGAIVRCAAALGAGAVVAGAGGVSPYSRKAIRSSSGAVFRVPVVESADPLGDWRSLGPSWERVATTVGGGTVALGDYRPTSRSVAVAFGSEGPGLPAAWTEACDHCLTIPMASGMDSLNVACTAAIVLHHLSGRPA